MKVIFYEIQNCDYELIDDKPAIIAPVSTNQELLRKYRFIQLLDGRWVHYMTKEESTYMFNKAVAQMVVFTEDSDPPEPNKRPSRTAVFMILRICSLLLLLTGGCLLAVSKVIGCIVIALSAVMMFITVYSKEEKYNIERYNNSTHPIENKRYYNSFPPTDNRTKSSSGEGLKIVFVICGYFLITFTVSAFLLFYAIIDYCNHCEDNIFNSTNSCQESQE